METYLSLIDQYVEEYDWPAAIRLFQEYRKTNNDRDETKMRLYIQQMLPEAGTVNIKAILDDYCSASNYDMGKAVKWLYQNGETWKETLCGVYVSTSTEQKIRRFLETAIPVGPEFECFCKGIPIAPTPAIYTDFCSKKGKQLLQTRYHPFFTDRYFWLGKPEELYELMRKWYMAYSMSVPSDLEGYVSVTEGAAILGIKPLKLLEWLCAHEDYYICCHGRCLIGSDKVESLRNEWETVQPIAELVKQKIDLLPVKARAGAKAYVTSWLEESGHEWILPEGTFPQQTVGKLYTQKLRFADYVLDAMLNTFPTLPLAHLKEITGMPLNDLKRKAASGAVDAAMEGNGNYYISVNERRRVTAIHEQYVTLDEIVCGCLSEPGGEFNIGVHYHRENLIKYCNDHDWWGLDYLYCADLPMDGKKFGIVVARDDAGQLMESISLWVKGYLQTHDARFRMVTQKYVSIFPDTVSKLIRYEKQVRSADKPLVDMAYLLCISIQRELSELTDLEIEKFLIEPFNQTASLASCDVLADFLMFAGCTQRVFAFARTGKRIDVSAYPSRDYAVMMAHIVNDGVINAAKLIPKALENKKYADLWLYVALHMFASWRSTDYIRMIAPPLPYTPEEMIQRIRDGELRSEETRAIAEYFIAENSLALAVPNKTSGTSGVPKLYFYCPQSCLESFGLILAIAAAHHQQTRDAASFIAPVKHWTVIKRFFGDEFLEACGNRSFSGRRANKSLLQCIEYAAREEEQLSPAIAYFLASIIRSHKLTYGRLSETTDIYLRDATFSGATPEYIAFHMWERGVCSFVVDAMLKICYGEQYKRLAISQHTEVITGLGLTPAQTSDVLRRIQQEEDYACELVRSVCQSQETIENAMKQIAQGRGMGKDPYSYCLCKAVGMDCRHKDRLSCLGCQFEIRTKALLLRYAATHTELLRNSKGVGEAEKKRYMHLARTVTYPAMQEILVHLDAAARCTDMKLYKDLVQEVMTYGITSGSTL